MSASRKTWWIGGAVVALGLIAGAIVLIVILLQKRIEPPLPAPGSPDFMPKCARRKLSRAMRRRRATTGRPARRPFSIFRARTIRTGRRRARMN